MRAAGTPALVALPAALVAVLTPHASAEQAAQPSRDSPERDLPERNLPNRDLPSRDLPGFVDERVKEHPTPSASEAWIPALPPEVASRIDEWLIARYDKCWRVDGGRLAGDYVPQFRIGLTREGALSEPPQLLNPVREPAAEALAARALAAVKRCSPMDIPKAFQPNYERGYRVRIVRFDAKEMR